MNHIRHSGIFDARNLSVALIGLGGIGAITALTLAKMGVGYLTLIDDDSVSEENLATQLYKVRDLGAKKTIATQQIIDDFTDDVSIDRFTGRVVNNHTIEWSDIAAEIVVSGVDSITSRQEIWEKIATEPWQWYIDARMGAENLCMYIIDDSIWSRDWYSNILLGQFEADVPDAPCTSKATFFCACLAAAFIGSTVRKIITEERPPKILTVDLVQNRILTVG
jgi:hypothetical protein